MTRTPSRYSPISNLMALVSRQETLDRVWERLPMLVVDISANEDGIVLGSGRVLLTNQAAEQLFGYQMAGAMRGLLVEELIPTDRIKQHQQHVSRYAQNPEHRAMGHRDMHLLGKKRDGSTFEVSIELLPTMMQETIPCVIVVVVERGNNR